MQSKTIGVWQLTETGTSEGAVMMMQTTRRMDVRDVGLDMSTLLSQGIVQMNPDGESASLTDYGKKLARLLSPFG